MRPSNQTDEAQPMDPIALTLAVWLGIIVAVTGLIRLSENAAEQARLAQAAHPARAQTVDSNQATSIALVGFGG